MVILKRDNKGELEIFEVPESLLSESELQKHKIFSASHGEDSYKEAIDIYKMEYERCAQRYNDLYNAAWTNFSYMALIAGGLLTFGGARFVTPLTAFLACLPLLFWWIATFEPLNRYGDKVQEELGAIERALTALCVEPFKHDKNFPEDAKKGITHFQNFAQRGQEQASSIEKLGRVRRVVRATALLFMLMTVGFGVKVGSLVMRGESLTVKGEPLSVLVTTPTPTATPTALPTSSPVLKSHRGGM
jgi:hypothetical protein